MAIPIASMGSAALGAFGGGGGAPSTSVASTATSRSGDVRSCYEGNSIGGGPGGRAFQNFVNFGESPQNIEANDQGGNAVNPGGLGGFSMTTAIMIFGAICVIVFVIGLVLRKG